MLSLTSFLSRSLMMSLTSFLSSTSQKKLEELETAEVTLSSEIATACSRMDELDKETEQILIELKDITVKRMLIGCSLYLSDKCACTSGCFPCIIISWTH